MSQAKVDRYKQEKANRKETIKKEKREHAIRKTVVAIVAVAIVGWFGYSAVNSYNAYQPKESVEVDYSALDNISAEYYTE